MGHGILEVTRRPTILQLLHTTVIMITRSPADAKTSVGYGCRTTLLLLAGAAASVLPSCHSFHLPLARHHVSSTSTSLTPPPISIQNTGTHSCSLRSPLSSTAVADVDIITNDATVGDADRSFRRAVYFEQIGLFRAAAESFHEAATLYQCFLDGARDAYEEEEAAKEALRLEQAVMDADRDGKEGQSEETKKNGDASNQLLVTESGSEGLAEVAGIETAPATPPVNAFAHVTGMDIEGPNSCLPILAYACVRLAHLSHDALGDPRSAARLYRDASAIDPVPSSVSYDGMGTSIEASGGSLSDAVEAYREAARLNPTAAMPQFHLAVALERLGQVEESEPIMEKLRRSEAKVSCLVDSWGYCRWHTRKEIDPPANLHRGTRTMLQIGLQAAMPMIRTDNGLVCEFGVATGRSMRMMQEILPLGTEIHGFDTFTGIPQAWGDEPAGAYSTGGAVPNIEGKVSFHKGLFRDTIPAFLESLKTDDEDYYQPLAFANVDCDLYGSTLDVLEKMHSRIVPGTILVFDEYLGHPTWRQDEFRAWRECCKRFGWQYRYLAFSLSTKQAVVQVTA